MWNCQIHTNDGQETAFFFTFKGFAFVWSKKKNCPNPKKSISILTVSAGLSAISLLTLDIPGNFRVTEWKKQKCLIDYFMKKLHLTDGFSFEEITLYLAFSTENDITSINPQMDLII